MKRYTDWNWTPLAWHSFVKYVSLPLGFLINLLHIPSVIGNLQYLMYTEYEWVGWADLLFLIMALGLAVAPEIGLIRRRWWGPCCLFGVNGLYVVNGLYLMSVGSMIEAASTVVSQGLGIFIIGALKLGINWVYYQNRRALFSPAPVWLEAENAVSTPRNTEYAYAASQPEAAQAPKAAGGYNTIYREKEPENTVVEAASVRAMEEAREEPGDGVALLLQLQAEEEAKRAAETLPVTPHKAPKKKSAPLWSVITLGALCVALAITSGALGWEAWNVGRQRDELATQVADMTEQVDTLTNAVTTMSDDLDAAREETGKLSEENSDLINKYVNAFYYKNMLNHNIGFIVNGSKYYHTIDCTVFKNANNYWAHNVEYCVYLGYSQCPLCGGD